MKLTRDESRRPDDRIGSPASSTPSTTCWCATARAGRTSRRWSTVGGGASIPLVTERLSVHGRTTGPDAVAARARGSLPARCCWPSRGEELDSAHPHVDRPARGRRRHRRCRRPAGRRRAGDRRRGADGSRVGVVANRIPRRHAGAVTAARPTTKTARRLVDAAERDRPAPGPAVAAPSVVAVDHRHVRPGGHDRDRRCGLHVDRHRKPPGTAGAHASRPCRRRRPARWSRAPSRRRPRRPCRPRPAPRRCPAPRRRRPHRRHRRRRHRRRWWSPRSRHPSTPRGTTAPPSTQPPTTTAMTTPPPPPTTTTERLPRRRPPRRRCR